MIEPPKEIYIDLTQMHREGRWYEKPLADTDIPYILKPRWIPVEEGLPEESIYFGIYWLKSPIFPILLILIVKETGAVLLVFQEMILNS